MDHIDTHRKNPPRTTSKRHKTVVSLFVVVALGLTISTIAWAVGGPGADHRGHGPRGDGDGPMMGRFMVRALDYAVDLDDAQRTAIEQIVVAAAEDGRALRTELGDARKEIADWIHTNGYAEDQVRAMVEARSTQMVDLMMLRIRTMAAIHDQLTPEQQATFKTFMEKGPRGKRHGRHRRGPPPSDDEA